MSTWDPYGYQPPQPGPKHSGLGIAAFALSIGVGIGLFVLIVIAGLLENSTPGGLDDNSKEAMLIGLAVFGLGGIDLVAATLAFASLFQANRKKLFVILGLVFSLGAMLGVTFLIVIGLMLS